MPSVHEQLVLTRRIFALHFTILAMLLTAAASAASASPSPEATVYYRGSNGQLNHLRFENNHWHRTEHGYASHMGGNPSVGRVGSTRYTFYRGSNGRLNQFWFNLPNWNQTEHGYNNHMLGDPAVVVGDSDTRYTFYRGTNGKLNQFWFNPPYWNQTEHGSNNHVAGDPAAVVTSNDNRYVYYRTFGGQLGQFTFTPPHWNQTESQTLHGYANHMAGDPAAVVSSDDTRYTFYRGANGKLNQFWFDPPYWNQTEYGASGHMADDPAAVVTSDDTLYVYYRDSSGRLTQFSFGPPRWDQVINQTEYGESQTMAGRPSAFITKDDVQYVFYRGTDGLLYEDRFSGNTRLSHTSVENTNNIVGDPTAVADPAFVSPAPSSNKITTPAEGDRRSSHFTLRAAWGAGNEPTSQVATVEFQIKTNPDDPESSFETIPETLVTDAQGQPITWPFTINGVPGQAGTSPALFFNAKGFPWLESHHFDEAIEFRAIFGGSSDMAGYSAPIRASFDRNVGGSSDANEAIGPGEVNLLSGNYTISRTDVSIPVPGSEAVLEFTRTYHSQHVIGSEVDTRVLGDRWQPSSPISTLDGGTAWKKAIDANEIDEGTFVALEDEQGYWAVFDMKSGGGFESPKEAPDWVLTRQDSTHLLLTDPNGVQTTFAKNTTGETYEYAPESVSWLGDSNTKTRLVYSTGANKVLQKVIAPSPAGVSCSDSSATTTPGCRVLALIYRGPDNDDNFSGTRLDRIAYHTATGQSQDDQVVAQYEYDNDGRLTAVWDPRISPALKETYTYEDGEPVFTADKIAAMPVTESFDGSTQSSVNFDSDWSQLGWVPNKGRSTPNWGWNNSPATGGPPSGPGGAYHETAISDDGSGIAVVGKLRNAPFSGYFSLWLDMATPVSARGGYELRFNRTAPNTYNVELAKWDSGTETVLESQVGVTLVEEDSFALLDKADTVSVWTNAGGSFSELFNAEDDTFSEGYAGLETDTGYTGIREFKVGNLRATGANKLTELIPPGEEPWTFEYYPRESGSSYERLKSVSRPSLLADPDTATTTIAYDVPLSGSEAPYDLSPSAISQWGQDDLPVDATVVFPPDHVPGDDPPEDYDGATVYYMDPDGQTINSAAPSPPGVEGDSIETFETDEHGNVVRELTAQNRLRALAAQEPIEKSQQLDSRSVYNADGTEMLEAWGPLHEVQLENGSIEDARTHTTIEYDEGAPPPGADEEPPHLPTTETTGASIPGQQNDVDVRVAKTEYDWELKQPTKVIVDPGDPNVDPGDPSYGLNLETTTVYNLDGKIIEERKPSNPNGGDASTTVTKYYTAGAHPTHSSCGVKPAWANLPCLVFPDVSDPTKLTRRVHTYSKLDQPTLVSEGRPGLGQSRITSIGYDAAGRQTTWDQQSIAGGYEVPTVQTLYSPTTGRHETTRFQGPAITTSQQLMDLSPVDSLQVESAFEFGLGKLGWANNKGEIGAAGWKSTTPNPSGSGGIYHPMTITDAGSGAAVSVRLGSAPDADGDRLSLWLDMATPSDVREGYELRLIYRAPELYDVSLVKWENDSSSVLESQSDLPLLNLHDIALVDHGGSVSAWANGSWEFTQILTDDDATFSSGRAGIEVMSESASLVRFKAGSLGPSTAGSLKMTYDTLGRPVSYDDSDGNTSFVSYDLSGRPVTALDGKGSQTNAYDEESGALIAMMDSSAGSFTARYDADGNMTEQVLPNGLVMQTGYDEAGDPVHMQYEKVTGCSSNCTWLEFDVASSIHGQWLGHAGTLSNQEYAYDNAGRLILVKDTPQGEGCTTRAYAFDANTNRTSVTTREPGAGGACDIASTGEVQTYSYNAADRLTNTGTIHDGYGRITKLPGELAGGGNLVNFYYSNDLIRSQTQDGVTNTYELDANLRQRERITTGGAQEGTEIYHYAGESDSPAWIDHGLTWTRNIAGIDGVLTAIEESTGDTTLQLTNLHGDLVATASLDPGASGPIDTFEFDEYGNPKQTTSLVRKYGWLGAKGRRTELASGVVQMGVRSYVPALGRFTSTDPVKGGSANDYEYATGDPVNTFDLDGQRAHRGRARKIARRRAARRRAIARARKRARHHGGGYSAGPTGPGPSPLVIAKKKKAFATPNFPQCLQKKKGCNGKKRKRRGCSGYNKSVPKACPGNRKPERNPVCPGDKMSMGVFSLGVPKNPDCWPDVGPGDPSFPFPYPGGI